MILKFGNKIRWLQKFDELPFNREAGESYIRQLHVFGVHYALSIVKNGEMIQKRAHRQSVHTCRNAIKNKVPLILAFVALDLSSESRQKIITTGYTYVH